MIGFQIRNRHPNQSSTGRDAFYLGKTTIFMQIAPIHGHLFFENRPMLTFTIVKPKISFILHHFRSRMLWKSTNENRENHSFCIIFVHLCFENRPMLTFTIVKPKMSFILHHFRSRMLWKSTNDHFYNSKTAKILHFASFSFTYAVKIDQCSLLQ